MPDVLGYRAKVGVLVPSTNTIVEPELYAMAPPGVTFHVSRMYLAVHAIGSDAEGRAFLDTQRAALSTALRDVLTLEPDHLLLGITALSFLDGVEGHRQFKRALEAEAGLRVTTAAEAADAALSAYQARRLAILSPLPPMMDAHFRRFFGEAGYEVVRIKRLECPTTLSIAQVGEATLRAALTELAQPEVDAILQLGADLAMARLADEAERWLGKPVIAITAAMLWHALRTCGIRDQLRGFGTLLRDH
jgi:maleate isomerase